MAVVLAAVPTGARSGQEKLVPANFQNKTDSLGFNWDIRQHGTVDDGTNDCFDTALRLMVNGQNFSPNSRPMMTADGSEYVIGAKMGDLAVTRRVRVDTKRSAARYLEVFENAGTKTMDVRVRLHTNLGGSAQMTVSSSGKPFAGGSLGRKDAGFATISMSSRPCVLFLVASHRSKVKPTVHVQRNRSYAVDYRLTLRPKAKASLYHLIAQRRGLHPTKVADAFKPFYRNRLVRPDVPRELRRTVLNFRAGLGGGLLAGGKLIQFVADLAATYGADRGKHDVLIVDEGAHLTGEAHAASLEVETRFEKARVPLEEVALLYGGAGVGRPMRLYLRNGEVLAGTIRAGDLRFTTRSGMTLALAPARINLLLTRARKTDGQPAQEAAAYVRTHQGDRLAVGGGEPVVLEAATAWGPLSVPLKQVKRLAYAREPQPGLRLALADHSRFPVVLRDKELRLHTLRFGPVTLPAQDIAAMTRIVPKVTKADTSDDPDDNPPENEVTGPHCTLAGDHVLAGTLAAPRIHVVTATGVTPVDVAQLHR
ncbi:MAG: hypothetical protein ACODAJ_10985, partial [Planctomycetota bacterium]